MFYGVNTGEFPQGELLRGWWTVSRAYYPKAFLNGGGIYVRQNFCRHVQGSR